MSGAEVIGLISGIITLIDMTLKVYQAAADTFCLPPSLRDVAARLPLIQDTLETAQADFSSASPTISAAGGTTCSSPAALTKVLVSCHEKTEAINKLFRSVIPASGASRAERYRRVLRTIPRCAKVEDLMAGILADLQVITGNQAVKAATRAQMERLIDAFTIRPAQESADLSLISDNRKGGRWNVSSPTPGVGLYNYGTGMQYLNTGGGDQNLISGNGVQVNAGSGGTFYFGRMN